LPRRFGERGRPRKLWTWVGESWHESSSFSTVFLR
jgi:hypothetical protein